MISDLRKTVAIAIFALTLASPVLADSGSFIGVQGEKVSGKATLSASTLKLSSSFKSSSGPDLFVYLGNSGPSKLIAPLKKTSGSQTYTLPTGIDISKYSAVFIHCKRFNHTFGKARLR